MQSRDFVEVKLHLILQYRTTKGDTSFEKSRSKGTKSGMFLLSLCSLSKTIFCKYQLSISLSFRNFNIKLKIHPSPYLNQPKDVPILCFANNISHRESLKNLLSSVCEERISVNLQLFPQMFQISIFKVWATFIVQPKKLEGLPYFSPCYAFLPQSHK